MSSKLKNLKAPLRQAASTANAVAVAAAAVNSKRLTSSGTGIRGTRSAPITTATTLNGNNNRRFNNNITYNRSSPFKSFITTGPRVRNPLSQSNDFAYDLSKEESKFMGSFKGPMKAVPDSERELLKSGQRGAYLAMRYEHSPDRKYNYPEATSWRIGWLHNQLARQRPHPR